MSFGPIEAQSQAGKSGYDVSAAGSRLGITALGGLTLRFSGKPIEVASRKAKALIGYLALAPNGTASREHLVGLLWSETEEEKARASLRQAVRVLRATFQQIAFDGLLIGRNDISLDQSAVDLDVKSVLNAVAESRVPAALLECERVTDSLISGYDEIDPSFRNWLRVQRENLSQKVIRGLEAALDGTVASQERNGNIAAEALVLLDPTNERACRHLIRRHAEAGDVAAALGTYNRLWELLDREYDVEPSDSTQELIVAVKLGKIGAASADHAPGEAAQAEGPAAKRTDTQAKPQVDPARLTLLISQFDLEGINDEQKHICLGFRSELLSTLVRFRIWSIVDVAKSAFDTASILTTQSGYLLHGNLYQDAENVYLIMELQDPTSGVVFWSERFVLRLDSYFSAHERIVRKIAYSLNVHISQERLRRVSGQADFSLDTYDRWLRGQAFVLTWKPDLRPRAAEIFQSIIADSPSFAPAYSSLVSLLNSNHFVFPGINRTDEVQKEALRLAKKAVEIDPLDSRSQLHLAWSQAMNGDHGIAELGFKLACELNENDSWTIASAAGGFAFCGRPEIGYELSQKGLELAIAPVSMVWAYVGCVRHINQDFEGCIEASAQAEDEVLVMLGWKAAALSRIGRRDEAGAALRGLLHRIRGNWHGRGEATKDAMIDWLVQCFPIRDRTIMEDLRADLSALDDARSIA